jgi:2-hydroxy-6-oxonona-2,4-dienedioate hydrolase
MPMRRMARVKSLWTSVKGSSMYARTWAGPSEPDSPTVILVHGMVVSSRYMVPAGEQLSAFCRVYAPDLPGYGHSDKPRALLNVSGLADALADWMHVVDLSRAALLGNSYGCQIIAEFAVRHPALIERAVLQGPTSDPSKRSAWGQIKAWLVHNIREPGGMTGIMIRDYRAAGLRRAVHTFFDSLEDHIEDKLPHISVPTLVVRGTEDVLVTQAWVERVTALLPNGHLIVIPGVMHTINFNQPLELARVVRPFLLEGRAAAA